MTTYSKETALYNTGAIGDDIADAGTKADNYISIDGTGINVHPANNTNDKVNIDSAGVTIYKNNKDVAHFGSDVRIGSEGAGYSRLLLSSDGAKFLVRHPNSAEDDILAHIGYGSSGNNSITNYYTFGSRKSGSVNGSLSLAEGSSTTASGSSSHAEGSSTTASGDRSHAEGLSTTASSGNSHAEGSSTTASGDRSHAEGLSTTASSGNSHAEGSSTTASGGNSHAEGSSTTASGSSSHAEGSSTTASGRNSHAEGQQTTASGDQSHAEGLFSVASGDYSHAQNYGTVSTEDYQTVIGKYNSATVSGSGTEADPYVYTDVGNYAFIIGRGYANSTLARSNALTVDWSGNVNIASGAKYKINGNDLSASDIGLTTETPTGVTISATSGTLVGYDIRRFGNVVQLRLGVKNTSATASGGNIFEGTISPASLRPLMVTTGATYYASYAVTGTISTAGTIVIRNSDSRSFSALTTNNVNISFTYIVA